MKGRFGGEGGPRRDSFGNFTIYIDSFLPLKSLSLISTMQRRSSNSWPNRTNAKTPSVFGFLGQRHVTIHYVSRFAKNGENDQFREGFWDVGNERGNKVFFLSSQWFVGGGAEEDEGRGGSGVLRGREEEGRGGAAVILLLNCTRKKALIAKKSQNDLSSIVVSFL